MTFETSNSNLTLCHLYLKRYAAKDLDGIAEMFAEDIVLRDWKIRVVGKAAALRETRKNFETADSIKIEVFAVYEDHNTIAAELKITVNFVEELFVVDVIDFNPDGQIEAIRAYRGRGDS